MNEKFEKHIEVQASQSVIQCLSENTALSNRQLKQVLKNGSVWLEGAKHIARIRRAKKILKPGDVLHIYYDENIQQAQPAEARLISDEGDYSIWYKPGGMLSQGSKWGDQCTIYRYAESVLVPQRPAFIVHRLDRAASGLIILAHKKSIAAAFSKLFENHSIYKKYQASVEGLMGIPLPMVIDDPIDGKQAKTIITEYEVDKQHQTTKLGVEIETGRKHQIRKHLSLLGYPIVGDRLYGAKNQSQDLQLVSIVLSFECPVSGASKRYTLDGLDG